MLRLTSNYTILDGEDFLKFYEFRRELGRSNSIVFEVKNKNDGSKLAVKEIFLPTEADKVRVKKEIQIMKAISENDINNYFVRIINFCIVHEKRDEFNSLNTAYILMDKGDKCLTKVIENRIEKDSPFTNPQIFGLILKLINAFYFLQNKLNISHGDIKPENILFLDELNLDFRICDVGSGEIQENDTQTKTIVGTVPFLAPELLSGLYHKAKCNSFKADVFSLGLCFIYIIALQKFGKDDRQNLPPEVLKEVLQDWIEECIEITKKPEIGEFLKMMLEVEVKNRPDFKVLFETLQHPKFNFLYDLPLGSTTEETKTDDLDLKFASLDNSPTLGFDRYKPKIVNNLRIRSINLNNSQSRLAINNAKTMPEDSIKEIILKDVIRDKATSNSPNKKLARFAAQQNFNLKFKNNYQNEQKFFSNDETTSNSDTKSPLIFETKSKFSIKIKDKALPPLNPLNSQNISKEILNFVSSPQNKNRMKVTSNETKNILYKTMPRNVSLAEGKRKVDSQNYSSHENANQYDSNACIKPYDQLKKELLSNDINNNKNQKSVPKNSPIHFDFFENESKPQNNPSFFGKTLTFHINKSPKALNRQSHSRVPTEESEKIKSNIDLAHILNSPKNIVLAKGFNQFVRLKTINFKKDDATLILLLLDEHSDSSDLLTNSDNINFINKLNNLSVKILLNKKNVNHFTNALYQIYDLENLHISVYRDEKSKENVWENLSNISSICQKYLKLKKFIFSIKNLEYNNSISNMIKRFSELKNLETLSLNLSNSSITNDSISKLCKNLSNNPNLKSLSIIIDNDNIDESLFKENILNYKTTFPNLKKLYLSFAHNKIKTLEKNLLLIEQNLDHFYLNLNDNQYTDLTSFSKIFGKLNSDLKSLSIKISGSNFTNENFQNLKEEIIKIKNLQRITLNFSKCFGLDENILKDLCKIINLVDLKFFHLNALDINLSDKFIQKIFAAFEDSKLEYVVLKFSRRFTQEFILNLATNKLSSKNYKISIKKINLKIIKIFIKLETKTIKYFNNEVNKKNKFLNHFFIRKQKKYAAFLNISKLNMLMDFITALHVLEIQFIKYYFVRIVQKRVMSRMNYFLLGKKKVLALVISMENVSRFRKIFALQISQIMIQIYWFRNNICT